MSKAHSISLWIALKLALFKSSSTSHLLQYIAVLFEHRLHLICSALDDTLPLQLIIFRLVGVR